MTSHLSVAEISSDNYYQREDSFFTITCRFIGSETPLHVTWSRDINSKTEEISDQLNFVEIFEGKEAVLKKYQPVMEDSGTYTCRFRMLGRSEKQPFAGIGIRGPR